MKTPNIVAHRGLHDEYPENSLKALLAAWDAGIEWCECDVRGSLEHEPFLFHDETLDRMTDGSGLISRTPAEVLHRASLRAADGSLTSLCVPRLRSVIASMPSGAKLLVEIKPNVNRETIRRTVEVCDADRCIIQSFNQNVLDEAEE